MNLVPVHLCNSSQSLYHYVLALLQQRHLLLHLVQKLWIDKIFVSTTNPHNQGFQQIFVFGPSDVQNV